MAHSKAAVERLSQRRLVELITFLLSYLKTYDPKAYKMAEKVGGIKGRGKVEKRGGGKRGKHSSQKQLANQRRFKAFVKKHGRGPRKGEKL